MDSKSWSCLTVFLLFAAICCVETQDPLERRVDDLDRKLRGVLKKLRTAQATIDRLEAKITNVGGGSTKFSDDPPCPGAALGFHFSARQRSCYHLGPSSQLVNWTEAEAYCQTLDPQAHLVSIETEEEQEFLAARWQTERGIASVSRFWTSGQRSRNGQWKWKPSNKLISKYDNWIPITLHNDDRFGCLATFSNEAYYWSDVACWAPNAVTCEIKVP